jgi:hypothetical protein
MTETRKANDLQEKANEIQEELKEVIKKYNKMMVVLTTIIIVLTILTLYSSLCNKTGRYAISGAGVKDAVYILDTKTSQLWVRTTSGNVYLGTNENPTFERISKRVKVKTSEEIEPLSRNEQKQ